MNKKRLLYLLKVLKFKLEAFEEDTNLINNDFNSDRQILLDLLSKYTTSHDHQTLQNTRKRLIKFNIEAFYSVKKGNVAKAIEIIQILLKELKIKNINQQNIMKQTNELLNLISDSVNDVKCCEELTIIKDVIENLKIHAPELVDKFDNLANYLLKKQDFSGNIKDFANEADFISSHGHSRLIKICYRFEQYIKLVYFNDDNKIEVATYKCPTKNFYFLEKLLVNRLDFVPYSNLISPEIIKKLTPKIIADKADDARSNVLRKPKRALSVYFTDIRYFSSKKSRKILPANKNFKFNLHAYRLEITQEEFKITPNKQKNIYSMTNKYIKNLNKLLAQISTEFSECDICKKINPEQITDLNCMYGDADCNYKSYKYCPSCVSCG